MANVATPSALQAGQDSAAMETHGDLRPKDAMFAKLHQGKKWFDSGEYFLSKEGKVPNDLLPGGAPVDSLPPKLSSEPFVPHPPTNLSQPPKEPHQPNNQPSIVSDY